MLSEQFFLTLPSNSSFSYYPNNTIAEFTTQLPRTIQLEGEWEVALAEIQYPRTWNNVGERQNRVYVFPAAGKLPQAKSIPEGYYADIKTLIENINQAIASAGKEASENIKFSYDGLSGRVLIEIKNGAKVSFLDDLAVIMGFEVPFQRAIDKTTKSPRVADVNAGLYSLFIYCNIIEGQLVGDNEVPLLRIIAVEGKHGDMVTKAFQNLQYLSIAQKTFNTIEVNIRTDTGEKVPFQSGKSVVTLHFRRGRTSYLL